jgi:hypothetical protein
MKIHDYRPLRKCLVLLVLVVLVNACSKPRPIVEEKLRKAMWLVGKWQNNTPKGVLSEVWRVKNDSTYAGRSSFVVGKDTVSSETVELALRGGKLLYIPTVKNQNGGQSVTFTEKTVTDFEMVFENPEHDFPQRITYTHMSGDSLVAVISGMADGREKSVKFPMQRIK